MGVGVEVFEIVPFVCAHPLVGEHGGGSMVFVHHVNGRFVHSWWVALEIAAYQFAVPRPVVLRVSRCMDANEATARLNVFFESNLLLIVQHIERGAEKNNNGVAFQYFTVEKRGILCRVHLETMLFPKVIDGLLSRRDAFMAIACCLGKNEGFEIGIVGNFGFATR